MNNDELFRFGTQAEAVAAPSPAGRLATCPHSETGGANSAEHHVTTGGLGFPPTVRLAHVDGAQGDCTLKGEKGVPQVGPADAPALLVSFYYLAPFLKQQHRYRYRDWVLDSGAFSAHNSGKSIDLNEYVDTCLRLLAEDPSLTEVFALDEIPKSPRPDDLAKAAERSVRNTEEMWRQGVPAVPCFHHGEPKEVLHHLARSYPKIALGGMVAKGGGILGQDAKWGWLERCFAEVWPKRIHGFGVSGERMVYGLPFHSVDATNWEIAPCAFGNWQKFGTMSVRGSNQDLRSQVRYYLDMEAKARVKWAKQMAELEALPERYPPQRPAPTVRLVANGNQKSAERDGHIAAALGGDAKAIAAGAPALNVRELVAGPLISPLSSSSSAEPEPEPEPAPRVKVRREKAPPKRSSDELPALDQKWAAWRP